MEEEYLSRPPRTLGMASLSAAILALAAFGLYGLWQASLAAAGPVFLLNLLPAFLAILIIPLLAYQTIALRNGAYILEREGVRLKWGLRAEDIPIDRVEDVVLASELAHPPPLPWLRLPGLLIGNRRLPDARPLEFMASRAPGLVLIATPERVYAISPAEPERFMQVFRRFTELGSLAPIPSRSVYPTFFISRFWADRPVRLLTLSVAVYSLGLLAFVSLSIQGRPPVVMRIAPDGSPLDPAPAVRLLLLPVLNLAFSTANLLVGLVLHRRAGSQGLAYVLWASALIVSFLFTGAVIFILRTG